LLSFDFTVTEALHFRLKSRVVGIAAKSRKNCDEQIIGARAALTHLVKMDGEFRCVERFTFAQVLARSDDLVPGFERHILVRDPAKLLARLFQRRWRISWELPRAAFCIEFRHIGLALALIVVFPIRVRLIRRLTPKIGEPSFDIPFWDDKDHLFAF